MRSLHACLGAYLFSPWNLLGNQGQAGVDLAASSPDSSRADPPNAGGSRSTHTHTHTYRWTCTQVLAASSRSCVNRRSTPFPLKIYTYRHEMPRSHSMPVCRGGGWGCEAHSALFCEPEAKKPSSFDEERGRGSLQEEVLHQGAPQCVSSQEDQVLQRKLCSCNQRTGRTPSGQSSW